MELEELFVFLVMLLASIGALNWGLVTWFGINLVDILVGWIGGQFVLYSIIGIIGLVGLISAIAYGIKHLR